MIPARMNARWITVISGIAIGAICAALISIPAVRALEQQYGLQGLFDLRGPVEPPDHAVLVLMNERSADSISLPRDAERFHRCEDLRVGVRPATAREPAGDAFALAALCARVAAEPPCRSRRAARRLRRPVPGAPAAAGRRRRSVRLAGRDPGARDGDDPSRDCAESGGERRPGAARGAQSGHCRSGARRRPVSAPERAEPAIRSLHGVQGRRSCDSDAPSRRAPGLRPSRVIRSCAISWYATRARTRPCCLHRRPSSNRMASSRRARLLIRELAHKKPAVAKQLRKMAIETRSAVHDPAAAQAIGALGALYAGDGTRLLNPYGPAGTIPSVGYDEVLTAPAAENVARFGGRAVFVGYGETSRTEQVEHFSTVYSQRPGRGPERRRDRGDGIFEPRGRPDDSGTSVDDLVVAHVPGRFPGIRRLPRPRQPGRRPGRDRACRCLPCGRIALLRYTATVDTDRASAGGRLADRDADGVSA